MTGSGNDRRGDDRSFSRDVPAVVDAGCANLQQTSKGRIGS